MSKVIRMAVEAFNFIKGLVAVLIAILLVLLFDRVGTGVLSWAEIWQVVGKVL